MHLCQAIYSFLVYVLSLDDILYLLHVSLKSPCSVFTDTYLVYPKLLPIPHTARKFGGKKKYEITSKQPEPLSYDEKDCFVSKQCGTKQSYRVWS